MGVAVAFGLEYWFEYMYARTIFLLKLVGFCSFDFFC